MDDNKEIWSEIAGLNYRYLVSNCGRIKYSKTGKIRKNTISPDGYVRFKLRLNGKTKTYLVHVLVAKTFKAEGSGCCVHHINNVRSDNRITNLVYATAAENSKLRLNNGRKKGRSVNQLTTENLFIKTWSRICDFPCLDKERKDITEVCRGRLQSACGFKWTYHDPDLENEEWRKIDINGSDISVSSLGRVIGKSGLKSFGNLDSKGYRYTRINGDKVNKVIGVHRLVCMAFNGNPKPNQTFVNHIDEIKNNNIAVNLEWASPSENSKHTWAQRKLKPSKISI